MLGNYFKTAIRNIFRHKVYVIINILGLAISLTCSLLIFIFVRYEFSFDKFNSKYKRIYRLYVDVKFAPDAGFKLAIVAAPTAKTFKQEFPEVETAVRMASRDEMLIQIGEHKFIENHVALADSDFFKVFTFHMLKGNPDKALVLPHSIVLTKSQAIKYFGKNEPIGKHLYIGDDKILYTVTGMMEDVPNNCHFEFDMLISMNSDPRVSENLWLPCYLATYVVLKPGIPGKGVESKIPVLIKNYVMPQIIKELGPDYESFKKDLFYGIYMQPLSDVHLNPNMAGHFKEAIDLKYTYIFACIALLILVLAAINYVNLSTARSITRSHEVGLRKVMGSNRLMLIRQFIVESVLLCSLSLVLAIAFLEILLPEFNDKFHTHLVIGYTEYWYMIPGLILLAMIIGMLAGSYPALLMSSFMPMRVLFGKIRLGSSNIWLRSVLMIFQFSIAIWLIFSTIVMYNQIHFMMSKDLGFNNEQLMIIRLMDEVQKKIHPFKQEISNINRTAGIANSTGIPGYQTFSFGFNIKGMPAEKYFQLEMNYVDYDYLKTYGIQLAEGREFNRKIETDTSVMIINEEAVRRYNLKDPLNTVFYSTGRTEQDTILLKVIGITRDFHAMPLQKRIEPYVFMLKPASWDQFNYITIRLQNDNLKRSITQIEKAWQKYTNNHPLQYFFLDHEFQNFYKEERRTEKIAFSFSILAIFIACLGLFGLTSFATKQRAKEISLRKVMGSSISGIMLLFVREILILISISAIPAWIIGYILMHKWLQNFPYHISMHVGEFMLSFVLTLLIAFLTVCYRTYRAGIANPAEVLKYE